MRVKGTKRPSFSSGQLGRIDSAATAADGDRCALVILRFVAGAVVLHRGPLVRTLS